MDLTTGKTLWTMTYSNPPTYPELSQDEECDVAVLGAGEAGAICSWYLSKAGFHCMVVDKRQVGRGSTQANTGLVQFMNDMPLHKLIEIHGREKAVRFYRLCQQAVSDLSDLVLQIPYPTEYAAKDSLYFASSSKDVKCLEEEYRCLIAEKFPVEFLSRVEIETRFPFSKPAALWTGGDAQINPYRLTHSIFQHLESRGTRIFENTEIVNLKIERGSPVLYSSQGHRIRCKYVIFASGYETEERWQTSGTKLQTTYTIATEPATDFSGWLNRCLIWETKRPYLYLRTTADNRILVGGLDENTIRNPERDKVLLEKVTQLKSNLGQLFPEYTQIGVACQWSGVFATSKDGMPFIGRHPQLQNCFYALGYGGNGTVYYTMAGKILTQLLMDGSHPDEDLFDARRFQLLYQLAEKIGLH
ncbi:NAD(P)/FAD-dependent oxidoreductase [Alicyclobacillus tolerans]|uniref:NAD(P)/FAD-dependent oxidoreductase n=1 Tax=Alicyclobacillus TaxID=29330 RepID=UPI0019336753|nr:FAD-binding oxidoreductase [Alicyclobacillus sp. TC]QRF24144.1 FAD-binding oxidoreductase [Alicyclobacillus sp. TC]